MKTRNIFLLLALAAMILSLVGCSSGKMKAGTYYSDTGQTRGTVKSTMIFEKDGTCTYEVIRKVSKGLGKGSEEITETYIGTWSETDDNNIYKMILDGFDGTLYAEFLENGDIMVTSDSSWWTNETFSMEQ
ncbi:MAG: hypothetical protein HDR01_06685 [Lachnospiraceae bacterium]|nr:hypothetical protein [Lachnospiraceae bacterium]